MEGDYEDNFDEEPNFDNMDENFEQIVEEEIDQLELNQQKKELTNELYSRPPVDSSHFNEQQDFYFMQIDCDYYMSKREQDRVEKPVIRMFGNNKFGNSVLVHIYNFISYFYIEAPLNLDLNQQNLDLIAKELNNRSRALIKGVQEKDTTVVLKIDVVHKESVKFFKGKSYTKRPFLKIYTQQPSYVASLRSIFEKGLRIQNIQFALKTFESNMPYALRFMIDRKIVGIGWVRLEARRFKIRAKNRHISRCQVEIDVDYTHVHAMPTEGEFGDIAPIRVLSFDIECYAKKGFPHASRDPIIQIACVLKNHVDTDYTIKLVLTLKTCSNIPGAIVKSYEKEEDMLKAFQEFIQHTDPDFFLGYNITNFDFPYILDRAVALKIDGGKYGFLGRIISSKTKMKDGKYQSKAMGMRETKEITMEGRIQLDMLMHMHREQKLSSYSLNSVSFKFLKEQKEDVHHSIISELQDGNPETRKRLAVYCLKDAELPIKLMEKLMCIYNYAEMARVTGVPINFLFMRGQQIKVASQMYRKAADVDMLIPTERSNKSEGKYEGAYVLEPIPGFYTVPVATLDFASLYPSIMMAHNLCYSTLILDKQLLSTLAKDEYTQTPHGDYFIKSTVRKGLLPQILEELINARKKAKNDLAKETDPMRKAVLDGRQLALKISANSVYGFTGAQVGQLPCLEISSSVTAFGRQMIDQTKNFVMNHYNKRMGYKHDSVVIYGDTDSVMVKFGVETVQEAMELGRKAAELISQQFMKPIKLEFEKVYFPYLLMSKKRYAGVYWTKPEKFDKIDTKGIENVRRDNCAIIRILIDQVLKKLLVDRDVQGAIDDVKRNISDLLQNKVDLSLLTITKALSKNMEEEDDDDKDDKKKKDNKGTNQYKTKLAHVELAEKMRQRDEGTAPHIGDRIPYVIIAGAKGSRNYENAEDPLYVLDKDIPIDFDYYIDKQIRPPLERIFEHILPNVDSLFVGEHTKVRYIPKIQKSNTMLAKFIKVQTCCLVCRKTLQNNQALCDSCQPKTIDVYTQKLLELNMYQRQFAEAWTQCQRCQGSLHQEVICQNRDCPIFYKRRKLIKDLDAQQKIIDRFSIDW